MMKTSSRKSTGTAGKKYVVPGDQIDEGGLAQSAWHTWRRLIRNEAMGTLEGREHMLKRHEVVVRIIEANSKALRLTNEINGLDIQRSDAQRQLKRAAPADELDVALTAIQQRMNDLEEQRRKLEIEKEWLEEALANFDDPSSSGSRSKSSEV